MKHAACEQCGDTGAVSFDQCTGLCTCPIGMELRALQARIVGLETAACATLCAMVAVVVLLVAILVRAS